MPVRAEGHPIAKACRICRRVQPLSRYRADPRCVDGHRAVCLDCRDHPLAGDRSSHGHRPQNLKEATYCDGSISDPQHAARARDIIRSQVAKLVSDGAYAEATELAFQGLDAMGAALSTTEPGCAILADMGRLAYGLLGARHAAYSVPPVCRERPYGPVLRRLLEARGAA